MTTFKTILLSSAAALTLAAAGSLAQAQTTSGTTTGGEGSLTAETPATGNMNQTETELPGADLTQAAGTKLSALIGTKVKGAGDEVIGEIEDFAKIDGDVMAIVGVGGLLGLGEHDVALELDQLSYDGDAFIASGYTEAQLKTLPVVDTDAAISLDGDVTLSSALTM
ncbi:hypothetical protein [Actibacterium sp. D379-3]